MACYSPCTCYSSGYSPRTCPFGITTCRLRFWWATWCSAATAPDDADSSDIRSGYRPAAISFPAAPRPATPRPPRGWACSGWSTGTSGGGEGDGG